MMPRAEIPDLRIDLSSIRKTEIPSDFDLRKVLIKTLDVDLPALTTTLDLSSANVASVSLQFKPDSEYPHQPAPTVQTLVCCPGD
jgi:hypothetical protein